MLDSLFYDGSLPTPGFPATNIPYAILVGRTLPYRFVPNDGTMQQLKNSGALQLIHNRSVVDSIPKYDRGKKSIWAICCGREPDRALQDRSSKNL